MTTERDPLDALEDILQNMELAREFLEDSASVDELEGDPKTLYSVVRAIEVIGEATKRVAASVRKMDPEVPWKEMAGMRDKLIHAYETVDVELVLLGSTPRASVPASGFCRVEFLGEAQEKKEPFVDPAKLLPWHLPEDAVDPPLVDGADLIDKGVR